MIILDGVYAARPELADLVDVAVYLGVDPQTRARRYGERLNDPDWVRFWERGEAHYFGAVRPPASFDIQLNDDGDLNQSFPLQGGDPAEPWSLPTQCDEPSVGSRRLCMKT